VSKLTRDDIMAMVPGRELDCKIAKNVMGWTGLWTNGTEFMAYPPIEQQLGVGYDERYGIPSYSTGIPEAFEVVEKMKEEKFLLTLTHTISDESEINGYSASFFDFGGEGRCFTLVAKTAPEGICRAALLAMVER